jgi:NADH:quinone reductase (non-electrogenic)
MPQSQQRVVVLGGGYAGTLAAIRAAGRGRRRVQVTLVDPTGRLVQRLRMHSVAVGHEVATYDLAKLTGRRVANVKASAHEIDLDRSSVRVSGSDGCAELPFDRLVMATGSAVDLWSVPGVAAHAHNVGDIASAARLKVALRCLDGGVVTVCGGGLTGIEAAAEIAEARPDVHVRLVTADAFASWLHPTAVEQLTARLARIGVEISQRARVVAVAPGTVDLAGGEELRTDLTVWCGGFVAGSLGGDSGLLTDARGCVRVDESLRAIGHPEVYAVGDAGLPPTLPNGSAFRMTCQAGMPTAAHAADNIVAEARGREPRPFDFGWIHQQISLGRRDAVIQWVDRADRPKPHVSAGRRAAVLKEIVTRSAVSSIKLERRVPGSLRWRSGGERVAELAPSSGAVG